MISTEYSLLVEEHLLQLRCGTCRVAALGAEPGQLKPGYQRVSVVWAEDPQPVVVGLSKNLNGAGGISCLPSPMRKVVLNDGHVTMVGTENSRHIFEYRRQFLGGSSGVSGGSPPEGQVASCIESFRVIRTEYPQICAHASQLGDSPDRISGLASLIAKVAACIQGAGVIRPEQLSCVGYQLFRGGRRVRNASGIS